MSIRTHMMGMVLAVLAFCGAAQAAGFSPPETIIIPSGAFIMGSDRPERTAAYDLDQAAYGHDGTRKGRWYEGEGPRRTVTTAGFAITRTPITNADYRTFVLETGHRMPAVDAKTWASYHLAHPFKTVQRFNWIANHPPAGREAHPVVLVSHQDAQDYAQWLSRKTGQTWRLPHEDQWEKAMRGTDGRRFPWGNVFDPTRLNSHDAGPFDTLPVGTFAKGASPYGVLDGAGQVYEWTADAAGKGRFLVKGGSWDDRGCGVCRPAAHHGRPTNLKHILVGFRLVREVR